MTIFVVLLVFNLFISDGTSYTRKSVPELEAVEGDHQLSAMDNMDLCNQSDTCNGIDQVHLSIHDLQNRNCMCDEQCTLYGDCCKDSKFQTNSSTPQHKFSCIFTATNGFVYMKASCPTSWNQSQSIGDNCHTVNSALETLDVWILTPVTAHSGITYLNMFCAFCNDETNFNFWKIGVSCAPLNSDKLESQNLLDPNDILTQTSTSGVYPVVWQHLPKNTTYSCSWHGKSTNDTRLRYCVPRPEIICTNPTNCSDYTSYNTLEKSYKCHPKPVALQLPFVANVSNPYVIKVPPCQQIPQNAAIFNAACKAPPKPKTDYNICFPRKKSCLLLEKFILNVNITFLDNDTVFLPDLGFSYPSKEWERLNGTDIIYVCGSYIPRSTFHQIVFVLDDWMSEILIKLSIVGLLLHLFIFLQLPQMRNFSGKNLAAFCATLLLAFLCYEIGPKLPRCEITAIILHYSLLSCFTWSLVMSYDCWHALKLATKEFRSATGEHTLRFCIYCIISWLIPGLIVSTALYFELSSPEEIPCTKKIGYGKYNQCFISQTYGLITFFVIPASCMFLGNICFFVFTSLIIYGNQKSSVNPNSKIDFLMYIRLALMMGLTWTVGTLFYLTEYVLVGLAFSVLNMSQGVLILFAFGLKRKTLELLLEKHKENPKVLRILQVFVRNPVSEAPTTMTSVESLEPK